MAHHPKLGLTVTKALATGQSKVQSGRLLGTSVCQGIFSLKALGRQWCQILRWIFPRSLRWIQHRFRGPRRTFLILWFYIVRLSVTALPAGCDREFMSLEPIVKAAERRENEKAMSITNVGAALWLDKFEKDKGIQQKHTKSIEEQFILACAKEPRRFQGRLQKILYTEPNARSDAEESERQRWILTLGELLRHTSTPMGVFIQQDAERLKLLGSGRRASTLRARVRSIRKYIQWLTISQDIVFPKRGWNIAQVTYNQKRRSHAPEEL